MNIDKVRSKLNSLNDEINSKKEEFDNISDTASSENIESVRNLYNDIKGVKEQINFYEGVLKELEQEEATLKENEAKVEEINEELNEVDEKEEEVNDIKASEDEGTEDETTTETDEKVEEDEGNNKDNIVEESTEKITDERSGKSMNFNENSTDLKVLNDKVSSFRNSEQNKKIDNYILSKFGKYTVEEARSALVTTTELETNGVLPELFDDKFIENYKTIPDLRQFAETILVDKYSGTYTINKTELDLLEKKAQGEDSIEWTGVEFDTENYKLDTYSAHFKLPLEVADSYDSRFIEMLKTCIANSIVKTYNQEFISKVYANTNTLKLNDLESLIAELANFPELGIGTKSIITDSLGYAKIATKLMTPEYNSLIRIDLSTGKISNILEFNLVVVPTGSFKTAGDMFIGYSKAAVKLLQLKRDKYRNIRNHQYFNPIANSDVFAMNEMFTFHMPDKSRNDYFYKLDLTDFTLEKPTEAPSTTV